MFAWHALDRRASNPFIGSAASEGAVQSEERWAFNPTQIGMLISIWGHVSDTDGTISHRQLVKVVRSLLPPLGMGPDSTNAAIVKVVEDMGVVSVLKHR